MELKAEGNQPEVSDFNRRRKAPKGHFFHELPWVSKVGVEAMEQMGQS